MEATIIKNIQALTRNAKKPSVVKETKSSGEFSSTRDEYLVEPTETSSSLASLTYVSSKGFFFQ